MRALLYWSFLSLPTTMPFPISIILGGTWILASAQMPKPMMGRKMRKVMRTPVMMGVVRIWTRSSRGPPVGMVELWRPDEGVEVEEPVGAERVEDEECLGNGRSWRFSTGVGWVPVSSRTCLEEERDNSERSATGQHSA